VSSVLLVIVFYPGARFHRKTRLPPRLTGKEGVPFSTDQKKAGPPELL